MIILYRREGVNVYLKKFPFVFWTTMVHCLFIILFFIMYFVSSKIEIMGLSFLFRMAMFYIVYVAFLVSMSSILFSIIYTIWNILKKKGGDNLKLIILLALINAISIPICYLAFYKIVHIT